MMRLLCAFLLALTLTGCGEKTLKPEPGSWFILQGGKFEKADLPPAPAAGAALPWTVQTRVADLAFLGDKLYLAVNGQGVASLELDPDTPLFRYFYDPLIFSYRTISTLIPADDHLLCHLYFNKLLNTAREQALKIQGISLLKLFPAEGIYQFVSLPFQKQNPEWESVGFLPQSREVFFIEWKHADEQETRFCYTRFELPNNREEAIDRLSFRQGYRFQDIRSQDLPPPLKTLFQQAVKSLGQKGPPTAFQFLLRGSQQALASRYEYHPQGFISSADMRLFTLPVFQDGETYYLLFSTGRLLAVKGTNPRLFSLSLPRLPEGFLYRDLAVRRDTLLASWEESRFTAVAQAGLFLQKLPF